VLGKVAGVKDCVVMARGEGSEKQLVGYVVGTVESDAVKAALREQQPEYMVPSAVVKLEAMPLTANGKVDRKRLPAPEGGTEERYVAPRSPLEEMVAGIWVRVLKLERVGVKDNFFELGGHSLLATQVVSRLKEEFNVALPIRALFEAPTVELLAGRVNTLLPQVDTAKLGDSDVDAMLAELLESEG
jgi:acyl carrier protein